MTMSPPTEDDYGHPLGKDLDAGGRCEVSPIAAMAEDDLRDREFADTVEAVAGRRRPCYNQRKTRRRRYSSERHDMPAWMSDRSQLPKRPPSGSVA